MFIVFIDGSRSVVAVGFIVSRWNKLWRSLIQWSSLESTVEQGGVTRASVCVCVCVCVCVFRGVSYGEPASEKKKKKPAGTDPTDWELRVRARDERVRAGVLTEWRRIGSCFSRRRRAGRHAPAPGNRRERERQRPGNHAGSCAPAAGTRVAPLRAFTHRAHVQTPPQTR